MQAQAGSFGRSAKLGKNGLAGYQLSLVLPAWNEEATIQQAIAEAESALSALVSEYEIIVVDDGSRDATAAIVRTAAEANPHVKLVQHSHNRGYGAALRTGFEASQFDLVAFTDADCQFYLDEIEYMLPLTSCYAVTCGYRIDRQDPALRRFFSWGYNTLVGLLLGSPVHDLDCALKIFRRRQLASILPECNNFFVNTEMLTKARQQGLPVVEVGVHHRPRAGGESKVSLRDIPRTLSSLLPYWWSRVLLPGKQIDPAVGGGWFWAALLLLAVIAGGLLFPGLSYPLLEPDEGRYAEISREMLLSGDWVVPRLNHEPYLDKPPLEYWLVAGSYRLFGVSERSARLVPALSAFLTVLAVFLLGRRIIGTRAAFLGALVLTLMPVFLQTGRILLLDTVHSLFVTLSLLTAYLAVQGSGLRWRWWIASALWCALGVMTKGPVGLVLLAPPLIAYVWLNRLEVRPGLRHWLVYGGVILLVVAPWYAAAAMRDSNFAYDFIVNHHLRRFFVGTYHDEPIWYFIPVLVIGCLPWSVVLVPFARFLFSRSPAIQELRSPALGYFLLWAGWCALFFSLSRGKLPAYILPACPAIALFLGCYLEQVLRPSASPLLQRAHVRIPRVVLLTLAAAWIILSTGAWWMRLIGSIDLLIKTAACSMILIGMTLWGRRLASRISWGLSAVLVIAVILDWGHVLVPSACRRHAPLAQSEEVTALFRDPGNAVATYGGEWGSIPFQLQRMDVENFSQRPASELTQFLKSHDRTLLLLWRLNDIESIRWVVPPGWELRKVGDVATATVALIQLQKPPAPSSAGY